MRDELDKLLRSAQMPERSPGYWEHFPKRVVALLVGTDCRAHQRRLTQSSAVRAVRVAAPARLARRSSPTIWAAAGLATACVLIALLLRPHRPAPTDYAKLYREITGLFPNQVRAIVEDERGVHLLLSEKPNVPSSPPLLVRVCEPQQCRSVITFSGQRVRLNGQTVEVLADGRGKVLVVGERSVVHPTEARTL
jgi:hypothetical protein